MSVTYPYTDYPIAVPQGARLAIPCWRTDSEGAYRNFATDTVVGEVRRYHDDVTPIAVFDCAVIDNPVTAIPGEAIEAVIDAVTTEDLPPGVYFYSIEVTPALGAEYRFRFFGGTLTITR